MLLNLLFALFLGVNAQREAGLPYFELEAGKATCFVESVPQYLPVSISYATLDEDQVKCQLKLFNDSNTNVLTKDLEPSFSLKKVSYLSQTQGKLRICLSCPTTEWFSNKKFKWHLSVDLGDSDVGNEAAASSYSLVNHERQLRATRKRLKYLSQELSFNMDIHNQMNEAIKKLTTRIKYLSITNVILFALSMLVAQRNVRTFLLKKNFV